MVWCLAVENLDFTLLCDYFLFFLNARGCKRKQIGVTYASQLVRKARRSTRNQYFSKFNWYRSPDLMEELKLWSCETHLRCCHIFSVLSWAWHLLCLCCIFVGASILLTFRYTHLSIRIFWEEVLDNGRSLTFWLPGSLKFNLEFSFKLDICVTEMVVWTWC